MGVVLSRVLAGSLVVFEWYTNIGCAVNMNY